VRCLDERYNNAVSAPINKVLNAAFNSDNQALFPIVAFLVYVQLFVHRSRWVPDICEVGEVDLPRVSTPSTWFKFAYCIRSPSHFPHVRFYCPRIIKAAVHLGFASWHANVWTNSDINETVLHPRVEPSRRVCQSIFLFFLTIIFSSREQRTYTF
jgi:hypothetical protein